jgi:DNA-binding LacI/PurR family transcriptional regulator
MNMHCRIGLLLNDFGSEYSLGLEKGISQYCTEHGCSLFVFSIGEFNHVHNDFGYQNRACASLISKNNLDGLIFVSVPHILDSASETTEDFIASFSPLPVINIGHDFPEVPCITIDEKAGLRSIMHHLITVHECRNIILMGAGTESPPAAERREAYCEEMKAAGLRADEDTILNGDFLYPLAQKALRSYAKKHHGLRDTDAIVALNDDMACGCIDFCRDQKIRVPEDIIITGYDDILRASYTVPSLTSVTQHLTLQGILAAETLVQKISGAPVPHLQTIPTKALYRQSCGCLRKGETEINAVTEDGSKLTAEMQGTLMNGAEWYKKRFQMQFLIGYQEAQQNQRTLSEIRKTILSDLHSSDMKCLAICLYDTPAETGTFTHFSLPDSAYVFAAQDPAAGIYIDGSGKDIFFNPRTQMIPDGILDESSGKFYVMPLYQCRMQYGYIIFKPGDYDDTMYMMLGTMLSSVIGSAYTRKK